MNVTIAILVEEAEGLLELGNLVVGELIRHACRWWWRGKRNRGSEASAEDQSVLRCPPVDAFFSSPDFYTPPIDVAVTFGTPNYPNCPLVFPFPFRLILFKLF
jgi:hypothetical protein